VSDVRYAAIYARISTDKQSQLSPESQIRKCREAAEARGFRVLEQHIYKDGVSGVGIDRPAFPMHDDGGAYVSSAVRRHFRRRHKPPLAYHRGFSRDL